jgi:transcriptional antiterminator
MSHLLLIFHIFLYLCMLYEGMNTNLYVLTHEQCKIDRISITAFNHFLLKKWQAKLEYYDILFSG